MRTLKLTSSLFMLAMFASPALAQDFVDAKIQELFAQGYTHFEVSRGLLRTEIEAFGPNYAKLEIQISNSDGSVLSQRLETEAQADYERSVSEIAQTGGNISAEKNDDAGDKEDDLNAADDVDHDTTTDDNGSTTSSSNTDETSSDDSTESDRDSDSSSDSDSDSDSNGDDSGDN